MELRKKLDISSTWEGVSNVLDILYIKNKSGVLLDEPFQPERAKSLTLVKPNSSTLPPPPPPPLSSNEEVVPQREPLSLPPSKTPLSSDEPCFMHIRGLMLLSGYIVCGVELVSGSRTTEVYSGDDYIATCRGRREAQGVYQSSLDFPADSSYDTISLKLLSLGIKASVLVTRITLTVTEDYGGIASSGSSGPAQNQSVDLQDLMSSISVSPSVPPFLSSLLSSLQKYQGHNGEAAGTISHGPPRSDSAESRASDFSQMLSAFRQIKPMPSKPSSQDTPQLEETKDIEASSSTRQEALTADVKMGDTNLSTIEELIDKKMRELESRMKNYIDDKLAYIMDQMGMKQSMETELVTKNGVHLNGKMETLNEVTRPHEHNKTQNGIYFEDKLD